MGQSYRKLITFTFAARGLSPLITLFASRYLHDKRFPWHSIPNYGLAAAATLCASVGFWFVLRSLENRLDGVARDQADFLLNFPERYVNLGIFASATLSLFMELSVIRWQATVFPFLAFYKNLSMLAC